MIFYVFIYIKTYTRNFVLTIIYLLEKINVVSSYPISSEMTAINRNFFACDAATCRRFNIQSKTKKANRYDLLFNVFIDFISKIRIVAQFADNCLILSAVAYPVFSIISNHLPVSEASFSAISNFAIKSALL